MLDKRFLLFPLLITAVFSCAPQTATSPRYSEAIYTRTIEEEILSNLLPARVPTSELGVAQHIDARLAHLRVPGLGIALIVNDEVSWEGGYGRLEFSSTNLVTASTRFQAASMSKAVAAFGALVMVERGQLDLDTPVNEYLDDWQIPEDDATQASQITMSHLLSHTAALTVHGFPGYSPEGPFPSNVHVLDGSEPANTEPVRIEGTVGEEFRYSGGGYTVAEQVMEEISGQAFAELMKEFVLEPLGMDHSSFNQPATATVATRAAPAINGRGERHEDVWHVYPEQAAAGLWTTPADYARFILGVAAALRGDENSLFSEELAQRMVTPVKDGYGLGVVVQGDEDSFSIRHGGSNYGYKCSFVYYPNRKAGAVVMTSADNGSTLASEILRSVEQHFQLAANDQEDIDVFSPPEDFPMLSGSWRIQEFDHVFRIFVENAQLWIEDDNTAPWQLHHLGNDTYRSMEERAHFIAERDSAGSITSITIKLGRQTATATRIDS